MSAFALCRFGCAAIVAGLMAIAALSGRADANAFAEIQPSLVHLKIEAQNNVGIPLEGTATGFLITADGQVLTVYHLIGRLKDAVPETIRITARVGRKGGPFDETATVINALPELDLLLLKISVGLEPYKPVRLGTSRNLEINQAQLATMGFPENLDVWSDQGVLRSKQGPGGSLWGTDMEFRGGQSGSPVFLDTAEVVGIAKGQLADAATISFFVPIDLADPLLIPLRLEALEQRIAAIPDECRVCFRTQGRDLCAVKTECSAWSKAAMTGDAEDAGDGDDAWSPPLQLLGNSSPTFSDCRIQWKIECR